MFSSTMSHNRVLLCHIALLLSFSCLAPAAADVSQLVEYLTTHPAESETIAKYIAAEDPAEERVSETVRDLVGTLALKTAEEKRIALSRIYRELKDQACYALAGVVGREHVRLYGSNIVVNNPAATMSSEQIMSLLREDINVPLDEVVEVHCPTGQYKVKYINMAEAANNADWIVRTSSLVDIDRQNVAEWVGRVRWLLGASSVESNSDRAVRTIKGRLLLHGHPVPFARVAMIGENAGFIGIGGGYRSYINGLDVVQGIYDLPENCYASVTAIDGTFQIPVRAGGPYEFVAFLVNSATTRMEGITIKSGVLKEDVPYKGWMVGDVETRDLGDLNCVIEHRKAKKLPRAEVYAYVDKEAYARGSLVEAHFRVRNAGEAELAIEKIVTSCSCSKIRLCDKGQKLDIQWPLHLNAKDGVVLCMTITTKASEDVPVIVGG